MTDILQEPRRGIHSRTWQHALALPRVRGQGLRWASAGFRREPAAFFQYGKTFRLERVKKLVPVVRVLLFGPVASNLRESPAASDLRARVLITLPASRRSSFGVQRAPQSEPSR